MLHSLELIEEKNTNSIIILHGLFGSSNNWRAISKKIHQELNLNVYALDLRNHGQSLQSEEHTMQIMIDDVEDFIKAKALQGSVLLGHSLGGQVGMGLALKNESIISNLTVIDIAPRVYSTDYSNELAVLSLELEGFQSRGEIDSAAKRFVAEQGIRQFLLMNVKEGAGNYYYQLNTPALEKFLHNRNQYAFTGSSEVNALFIRGASSSFINEDDANRIKESFLNSELKTIEGAAHWLHHTHTDEMMRLLKSFLRL